MAEIENFFRNIDEMDKGQIAVMIISLSILISYVYFLLFGDKRASLLDGSMDPDKYDRAVIRIKTCANCQHSEFCWSDDYILLNSDGECEYYKNKVPDVNNCKVCPNRKDWDTDKIKKE